MSGQLYNHRSNPRALIAKGEALYATGDFETALVNFERGGKLRQCQGVKDGTKKCREAILLTLGKSAKFDQRIVKKVITGTSKDIIEKGMKKNQQKKRTSKSIVEVVKKISNEKRKDKKLLGETLTYKIKQNLQCFIFLLNCS